MLQRAERPVAPVQHHPDLAGLPQREHDVLAVHAVQVTERDGVGLAGERDVVAHEVHVRARGRSAQRRPEEHRQRPAAQAPGNVDGPTLQKHPAQLETISRRPSGRFKPVVRSAWEGTVGWTSSPRAIRMASAATSFSRTRIGVLGIARRLGVRDGVRTSMCSAGICTNRGRSSPRVPAAPQRQPSAMSSAHG
jgi:hypothetical protein